MPGVLLTGGSGFVGLNLAELLLADGREVVLLSADRPPSAACRVLDKLPGRCTAVQGDVRDRALLARTIEEHHIDRVFHGAAVTAGPDRERDAPEQIVDVNVLGTLATLRAARDTQVRRVLVASSGAVYGATADVASSIDETSPTRPLSTYGITKLAAEQLALRMGQAWEMDVRCGRVSAVFGPWERDTGVRDTLSPMLHIARAARRGEHVRIYDGGHRDWAFSRDVARAFRWLLDAPEPQHQVYNVAPGDSWHLGEWCQLLSESFPRFSYELVNDLQAASVPYDTPPDRPRAQHTVSRLRAELHGWPFHTPSRARQEYLDWLDAHPGW